MVDRNEYSQSRQDKHHPSSLFGRLSNSQRLPTISSAVSWIRLRLAYLLLLAVAFQLNQVSYILHAKIDWIEDSLVGTNVDGCLQQYTARSSERIIVVYTGPTSMNATEGKNWLYLRNFDYFLKHGIDCLSQDTILVLTESVTEHYASTIAHIQQRCESLRWQTMDQIAWSTNGTQSLRIITREDRCYDMEGMRLVFEHVNLTDYDYMVYLNCGVVGPKLPSTPGEGQNTSTPWTQRYTSLLSDTVKMSGLSINCDYHPHVQSMLFALDKVGLRIIQESGAVHDCGEYNKNITDRQQREIIDKYEVGMGRAILNAGYHIRSTHGMYGPIEIRPRAIHANLDWCRDIWYIDQLPVDPATRWEDFMFFKSSRMFLLPEMVQELQYEHGERFEFSLQTKKEGSREGPKISSPQHLYEHLWDGGARKDLMMNPKSLRVSVVVSYCRGELSWLQNYLADFNYRSVTVVSKCGTQPYPKYLPKRTEYFTLPNTGRVDHTMAYWMNRVIPLQEPSDNDIVVFLKDNLFQHKVERRREIGELLGVASANGFACLQKPIQGMSQFHLNEAVMLLNMTHYDGRPVYREDGSRIIVNSNDVFKSQFDNLGAWLGSIGIASLSSMGIAPVCYGGSYAVKASRVLEVPLKIRQKLEISLSRADNIEEGHFAERIWASLFLPTPSEKETRYIIERAQYVNWAVNPDGGGVLGALEEMDVLGPPQPLPSENFDELAWRQSDDGRWLWPKKYRARVIDSDNVCIRPMVEPDLPKEAQRKENRPATAAMCTVTKRSDLRYINEWLDYHVVVGFTNFYLYDSDHTPGLEQYLNATRPGWSIYISVIHWPGGTTHRAKVMSQCAITAANHPPQPTWLATLDADEFLVLRQHDHVVEMLEEKCQSGSVHMASYTFAPDSLSDEQRQNMSVGLLNESGTYKASASLSAYGFPRPLLQRNRHSGELGWDGNWRSLFHLPVETIVKASDLLSFDNSCELPRLVNGTNRKTIRGDVMNTSWTTREESGADIATVFRFPFKSIPEFICQECRGSGDSNVSMSERCIAGRHFALDPKAWDPYRYNYESSAWHFLSRRIPWYQHFDRDDRLQNVSCQIYHDPPECFLLESKGASDASRLQQV